MDRTRLEEWIRDAAARVEKAAGSAKSELVASRHVDEIDPEWPLESWDVQDAVEAFKLASTVVPADWTGRLALAVPLGLSDDPVCSPPPLDQIQVNLAEPPSLYLIDARFFVAVANDREEYRCPYEGNPWNFKPSQCLVEFVSSRDLVARARGWEFTNDLWLVRLGSSR